jgi:hypothetical protein
MNMNMFKVLYVNTYVFLHIYVRVHEPEPEHEHGHEHGHGHEHFPQKVLCVFYVLFCNLKANPRCRSHMPYALLNKVYCCFFALHAIYLEYRIRQHETDLSTAVL